MICGVAVLCLLGTIETRPAPVVTEVVIGDKGPYRFLVDTGSESTLMEPSLAAELGLRPAFRVELVNVNGSRLTPGTRVERLAVQGHAVRDVEVLFDPPRHDSGVRGVLGANALAALSYLLEPREGRLTIRPAAPDGVAVPFDVVDGRMVVRARMGGETLRLVLDSGASHVVLFRTPAAMARTGSIASVVHTLDGARRVAATTWTAEMTLGRGVRIRTLPAAMVSRPNSSVDGLLPAAAFKQVFVDQAGRQVVLVR